MISPGTATPLLSPGSCRRSCTWLCSSGSSAIRRRPAINPPSPETEIALASPSDIESDKPPAAKPAPPPSTPNSAPEIQARLPPTDAPPPEARRAPRSDAWAQSRVILSSQELADPRNRKAVEIAQASGAANALAAIVRFRSRSFRSIGSSTNMPPTSSSLMQPRRPFEKAASSSPMARRFTATDDGTVSPSNANCRPVSGTSLTSNSRSATRYQASNGQISICRERRPIRSAATSAGWARRRSGGAHGVVTVA